MALNDKSGFNTPLADAHSSSRSNIALSIGVVLILATLLVRMPSPLLDMLLACSLSISIAVLIITMFSREALDLSTFPSLLLFVTLFRLSLSVASTRLILLQGSAGRIIETFGEFVAGGSFVVGMVIFLIMFIIQFIVVTKGAERISEVSARFTLDAMPGKQMAIDADLNAGAITEAQANERRAKIVKESEFYGAMDGASKFIRGDAIATIIITIINIIGGIAIGYGRGMQIGAAVKTYCILSIGDGLVNQIPSMIISISSGFLVTKISSSRSVGQDLSKQLFRTSQPLAIAAFVIGAIGFVPGLPALPFLILASGAGIMSRIVARNEKQPNKKIDPSQPQKAQPPKQQQQPVEEMLDIDRISVQVGVRLISLVDPRKDSAIFDRIGALRRKFAQQLGIVMPLVRLRDNINIDSNAYEIRLFDHTIATGRLEPNMFLAMDSGAAKVKIEGMPTTEPVYGLPALWINETMKEKAEINGYTVIDPESVFITHLSETLKKHADELLTREDVQQLVDRLRKTQPSLVGDIIGELVPIGTLQRVLKNLLKNGIPIRELSAIIEALGECANKTKNPEILTEIVRKHLTRTITEQHKDRAGKICAITFDPALEHQMAQSLRQESDSLNLGLPSETTMAISSAVANSWKSIMDKGFEKVVLLCDSRLRMPVASMLARSLPNLPVVAYNEIVLGTNIEPLETVSLPQGVRMNNPKQELAGATA